jgi:hypothetical protein
MTTTLVVALLGVTLAGVGCHPRAGVAHRTTTREVISATQPMVIGFAPPVTPATLDRDAGLGSALEHWAWGLENTAACLKSSGVDEKAIQTDDLIVMSNNQRITLEVRPYPDAEGIGAYLVAPGKEGRLILLRMPSAFVNALPGAAAEFFDVADCCTQTARELQFCASTTPRSKRTGLIHRR